MTIRSCSIAFAFSLLATAFSAEPPPPALGTMFEPDENFALIMKDGRIYKNELR